MAQPFDKNTISNTINRLTTRTTMERDSCYYNMNHKNQGFAYIFWHQEFSSLARRNGADREVKNLETRLLELGFDVQLFKDLKLAEIQYRINEVSRERDHTNNNCFLLAILSHGDENVVAAYDELYRPHEVLWNQFTPDKCPSLAGKPKLFILNCCQGEGLDHGVELIYTPQRTETDGDIKKQAYTIPIQCDFCIIYATARGHYSFRNENNGSHFIRFLCEELKEHAYDEHLLTILTYVIRRLAVEWESKTKEINRNKKKQTTYFESSLTRLVKFVKKE